ncbi:MAG: ComF family protein [Panacagrimonas sp.]
MKTWIWVDDWIGLLAPERCAFCGAANAVDGVCAACRSELPWNTICCPRCAQPLPAPALCAACLKHPPSFDSAWTAFVHLDPVRHGIHRLKYAAQFDQGRLLGRLMAWQLARRAAPLPDLVIPVPLRRTRLYSRGYNQTLELGRALESVLRFHIDADAAQLVRTPQEQIGQTAAQRRRNLRGAFRIERDLSGLHVALLDDVMTTGATLDALARAARKAGAARIEAWALARAP